MEEEDYYEGSEESVPAQPESEPQEQEEPKKDESETFLINDTVFPSECKVGDKYTIEVVASYDGEKEARIVKHEETEPVEEEVSMDTMIEQAADGEGMM